MNESQIAFLLDSLNRIVFILGEIERSVAELNARQFPNETENDN